MKVINKKISELKPYKKNAKKHDKVQVERIAESIKEFGFTQPVLIDKDCVVVAGHGRILGAKKAGLTEVPTVCMEDLTEEQIKAYRLIDNKLNESPWDEILLLQELSGIDGIDMEVFGDWGLSKQQNEEEKKKYTRKINAPIYDIKGENPDISLLYDDKKTKRLIERIEASDLDEEQKQFLKIAAYRHTVFDYGKIAEFYCHQTKEVQELMEESALIILDYNRAYELGYVGMMNDLFNMNEDDEQNEF